MKMIKNDILKAIKDARTNPIQQIETMASELYGKQNIFSTRCLQNALMEIVCAM